LETQGGIPGSIPSNSVVGPCWIRRGTNQSNKEKIMAWRIADYIVRGEIDNRLPGIIKGTLYVEGLNEPLILELEGNCDPDLAGRHLTFRNLMPQPGKNLDGLCRNQCGTAGTMSANRMVRIPTITPQELEICFKEQKPIPTRWSESLYLEWFGPNGRVLVEGAGFTCQLTAARWTLLEKAHRWNLQWKERERDLPFDAVDDVGGEDSLPAEDLQPGARDRFTAPAESTHRPHPLVRRLSDFLLRTIDEFHGNKLYTDEAMENQPLITMIDAISTASSRLAITMAKASQLWRGPERGGIVQDLNRVRWSLAEAMENAGLAAHMGSAHPDWLKAIRRELVELRREIRALTHDFEEDSHVSSSVVYANPPSA
jgi:hypothetical protein